VKITTFLDIQLSPASLLELNIILSIVFSVILNQCSSLDVRDQASHPYKTTGTIRVLLVAMFTILDGRRKLERIETE
jgi:membrane protein CcdC involved in cytochrome C biogenesis